MKWTTVAVVALLTFGICFLLDRGFIKLFRSKPQHQSGKSLRLSKRYGSAGLLLAVLGVAAIFGYVQSSWVLAGGGILLLLLGLGLVIAYMTFGIFYDDTGFVLTTFGKKSTAYRYSQIQAQQLYSSYGTVIIELYMADGRSVQLNTHMNGLYAFMDTAFAGYLQQRGLRVEDCPFYDPENSCWFPGQEK